MTVLDKTKTLLSAIALLSFGSSQNYIIGVEGAIDLDYGVECHPDNPSICRAKKTSWTPSPVLSCASNETCVPTLAGGWGWEYNFMKGLEEGMEDEEVIDKTPVSLSIEVTLEDDETTCNIKVSDKGKMVDDDCQSCSAEGCEFGHVKYDCTNLFAKGMGKSSLEECEAVDEPFLYPFASKPAKTPDNSTSVDKYSKDSSSESRYAYPTMVLGFAGTLSLAAYLVVL